MMKTTTVHFKSRDLVCCADLYCPKNNPNGYTIVMAHGFSGERCFGLADFASAFCRQGFKVLVFDYRGFGDSAGQPRQLIDPAMQLEDWRQAINYALLDLDSNFGKIILWGSSFSGGHVVTLAAENSKIGGIIAQVPFVSGLQVLQHMPLITKLKLTIAALLDNGKRLIGLDPYTLPVVSEHQGLCLLANSYQGYLKLRPADNMTWKNAVPAAVALKLPFYNPINVAAKVKCPSLIIAAQDDELIPESLVRQLADKIDKVQYHQLASDHFEPYYQPVFDQNIELQLRFLRRLVT